MKMKAGAFASAFFMKNRGWN